MHNLQNAPGTQRFAGDVLLAIMPKLGDEDKSMFGNLDAYKNKPSVPNTEDIRYPGDSLPASRVLPEGAPPSMIDQFRDQYMRSPAGGIS